MKINLSEENSKRVLSGTKWLTNASQNYFTSLDNNSTKSTGSVKKIVNATLLVPIIVPTAVTALSIGFTILFLNAVNAQKDDSTLSKAAKGIARLLIGIAAFVIIASCIILNLVILLIPFLIFLAINKDIFNQKSADIESNQSQAVNKVKINNDQEYNQRIEEEVIRLEAEQPQNDEEQDQNELSNDSQSNLEQHHSAYNQALVSSGQLYNQPDVEIISRVEGEQAIDQTVIAKRINNDGVRDDQAVIRTVGDDRSVTMKGIMTGNIPDQEKGFASGFSFQCGIIEKDGEVEGVDFQFGMSIRTGNNQQEATQALMQSESARTMLSGDGGMLSIEQPSSSQQR